MTPYETMATQLIAALISALPAIIALFKLRELHLTLNSRLTELIASTRAEGVAEGKQSMDKGA